MDRRLAALAISTALLCAACGHDRIRTRLDLGDDAAEVAGALGKEQRAASKRLVSITSTTTTPPTTPPTAPPTTGPAPAATPDAQSLPIGEIVELFGPAASDGVVSPGEALFLQVGLRSEGFDEIADAASPEWLTHFGGQVCTEMDRRHPASENEFFVLVADVVAVTGVETIDDIDLVSALAVGGAMLSCADRFTFAVVAEA